MKSSIKNYFYLVLIYLILNGAGYIVTRFFTLNLSFPELSILLTSGLIVAVITSVIFFRGIKNPKGKSVIHTMSAIGIKFLLFLALLGIFAFVREELSWHFIVVFFIMYLSFTFYLLITFVNVLKLKNQEKPDDKGK